MSGGIRVKGSEVACNFFGGTARRVGEPKPLAAGSLIRWDRRSPQSKEKFARAGQARSFQRRSRYLREGSSPHGGDGFAGSGRSSRLEPGPASGRTRL